MSDTDSSTEASALLTRLRAGGIVLRAEGTRVIVAGSSRGAGLNADDATEVRANEAALLTILRREQKQAENARLMSRVSWPVPLVGIGYTVVCARLFAGPTFSFDTAWLIALPALIGALSGIVLARAALRLDPRQPEVAAHAYVGMTISALILGVPVAFAAAALLVLVACGCPRR